MTKFWMHTMHMSASAACADAASACAHTAGSRVVSILDAIFMASIIIFGLLCDCVLGVLAILAVLGILLVCGKVNPSEASAFA